MYNKTIDFDQFYHDYCETVLGVDDSIGRLMDTFGKEGLTDDTLIIFMRCHGIWDLYELYDIGNDPDQMNNLLGHVRLTTEAGDVLNLIQDKELKNMIEEFQDKLFAIVRDTGGVVEPSRKG